MIPILLFTLLPVAAHAETGIASIYRDHRVACRGYSYSSTAMIAAHKTLPCGSRVRVSSHLGSVVVTIVDRGPFVTGRIIDLTPAAAAKVGLTEARGLMRVTVEAQRP